MAATAAEAAMTHDACWRAGAAPYCGGGDGRGDGGADVGDGASGSATERVVLPVDPMAVLTAPVVATCTTVSPAVESATTSVVTSLETTTEGEEVVEASPTVW